MLAPSMYCIDLVIVMVYTLAFVDLKWESVMYMLVPRNSTFSKNSMVNFTCIA